MHLYDADGSENSVAPDQEQSGPDLHCLLSLVCPSTPVLRVLILLKKKTRIFGVYLILVILAVKAKSAKI